MAQRGAGFRDLLAWQRAYGLALDVYRATGTFPRDELFGLTSQMRRAAVSVPANIAEGYERRTQGEYSQFLRIARGSLGELETYLKLSLDLGYIDQSKAKAMSDQRAEVGRLLNGLLRSLADT
jgi:four helix bundle protein